MGESEIPSMPDPSTISSQQDLIEMLGVLRHRAARGTHKAKLSLDEIARRSGIPRSTVHAYLTGRLMPPVDALDAIVMALGVPPRFQSSWSEALYRISEQKVQQNSPAAVSRQRAPRLLPPVARGFVGRDAELVALTLRLEGEGGLVAVVGPGGVGKTSLVLEWARRNIAKFPHGQLYADLRGFSRGEPPEPAFVAGKFLAALGIPNDQCPADEEALIDLFRTEIADRQLLIFLDNARDAAQIRPLLPGDATVTVVVTSRDDLRSLVVREGAYRLALPALSLNDGIEILLRARPSITAEQAIALVNRCAGLPLALRIIAERLATTHPDEITAELDDAAKALDAVELIDAGVDVGIRGVLTTSYQALTEPLRRILRATGAIPGPWLSVPVLTLVTRLSESDLRNRLDELAAAHLIVPSGDGYERHDLVSAFAQERLIAEEGRVRYDELRHQVLLGYVSILNQTLTQVNVPVNIPLDDQVLEPMTETIDPELLLREETTIAAVIRENLVGGIAEVRPALLLAESFTRLAEDHGTAASLVGLLERTIEVTRDNGDDLSRAALLLRLGSILSLVRGTAKAKEVFQDGLRSAERANNPGLQAAVASMLGWMHAQEANLAAATEMITQAIKIAQEANDQSRLVLSVMLLGSTLAEHGRSQEAEVRLQQCYDLYAAAGNVEGQILVQLNRAESRLEMGELDIAQQLVDDALMLRSHAVVPSVDGPLCCVAALVAIHKNECDKAQKFLIEAEDVGLSQGYMLVTMRVSELRGLLAIRRRDLAQAQEFLDDALAKANAGGYVIEGARIGLEAAEVARILGDLPQCRKLIAQHGATADRLDLRSHQNLRSQVQDALSTPGGNTCLFHS